MRAFVDAAGRRWEVTIGKESFGTLLLLFSGGGPEIRKAVLAAETPLEAELEVERMSDDDLRRRLQESVEWS